MITPDVALGRNVTIPHPELVNLYGCRIGDGCKIAAFVEIQHGVTLGRNVKVEAFAFIPSGVTVEDGAFIGPHVCFTNDRYPSAVSEEGESLGPGEWHIVPTVVKRRAAIGANATIVCGVTIGEDAMVGAGSTVTRDVPARSLVAGNPGRVIRERPGPGRTPHPNGTGSQQTITERGPLTGAAHSSGGEFNLGYPQQANGS